MSKLLSKIQKSIESEKALVNEKPLSIVDGNEQFNKADEFFAARESKYPQNTPENKLQKQAVITSTFSLPENEYETVTNTLKIFAKNDLFIKQTEVFRIAISIMKNMDETDLLKAYSLLPKISSGKPKKSKI